MIPTGRLNKAALKYLNAFPLPNNMTGTGGNVGLSENYDSFPSGTQNFNDFDVRMDWAATSKDNVFVRYSYGQDVLTKESQYPNLPAGYGTGVNPVHPRGEAVGETHTIRREYGERIPLRSPVSTFSATFLPWTTSRSRPTWAS